MTAELWQEVWRLGLDHVMLVAIATGLSIVIGLPLGIWISDRRGVRGPVLGLVSILQTIPSLALFGLLLPVPLIGGVGKSSAITALTVYALLPIVRNTVAGLMSVDPVTREAALAMGATRWQLLRWVELPMASRTLVAGIRTAAVTTVGTATIAAAIGAGGLGELIFRGVASVDAKLLLAGSIGAAVIALATDALLGWMERRMKWGS